MVGWSGGDPQFFAAVLCVDVYDDSSWWICCLVHCGMLEY